MLSKWLLTNKMETLCRVDKQTSPITKIVRFPDLASVGGLESLTTRKTTHHSWKKAQSLHLFNRLVVISTVCLKINDKCFKLL